MAVAPPPVGERSEVLPIFWLYVYTCDVTNMVLFFVNKTFPQQYQEWTNTTTDCTFQIEVNASYFLSEIVKMYILLCKLVT